MNKEMAKTMLAQGFHLTHYLFSKDEFIYQEGMKIFTEEGYSISQEIFWQDRDGKSFDDGWNLVYRNLVLDKLYYPKAIIRLDEDNPHADILILKDGFWMPMGKYVNDCTAINGSELFQEEEDESFLPDFFMIKKETVEDEIVKWDIQTSITN